MEVFDTVCTLFFQVSVAQGWTINCLLQVQQGAVGLVEGLSGSLEGVEKLLSESDKLLPALLKLIGAQKDISKGALTSLINLSQACSTPPRDCVQSTEHPALVDHIYLLFC